jgi:phospholipase D1/2
MSREQPEEGEEDGQRYVRMPPEPEPEASSASFRLPESARVFDELPRARIVAVSRPDAGDITPMLLSYTVELQYKQVCPSVRSSFPSSPSSDSELGFEPVPVTA